MYDSYRRLIMMYADVVMEKAAGLEPAEGKGVRLQLEHAMEAVKKANPLLWIARYLREAKEELEKALGVHETYVAALGLVLLQLELDGADAGGPSQAQEHGGGQQWFFHQKRFPIPKLIW